MKTFQIHKVPRSRIATFDVFAMGLKKHHVSALLEFDVTDSRIKIKEQKKQKSNISFTSWLVKEISSTLAQHPMVASFLLNKRKIISFDNIKISLMVEKEINNKKVPIPLVIDFCNTKSIEQISQEIEQARQLALHNNDIVINRKTNTYENTYYLLPGFLRRFIWKIMLNNPKIAYKKMGNAVITSLTSAGTINGWFLTHSVHPVSFGIGSVLKKPVVKNDEIKIREILNMTVLMDHDVIDGAPMTRFIKDLTKNIETASQLK